MGRHAGWTTAACALAADHEGDAPHVLLLPEVEFDEQRFLGKVKEALARYDQCVIAVSEGIRGPDGEFLSASGREDSFGHAQLGGVAPLISNLIGRSSVASAIGRFPITSCGRHATSPRKPMSSRPTQSVGRRLNSRSPERAR
jgi:6-phosphofructokinase